MMPEVSGYPLESIKDLFEKKKWFLVGCTQNRPLRQKDTAALGDEVPKLGMQQDEEIRNSADLDKKEEDEKDVNGTTPPNYMVTRTQTANE
jgi:hypothetical protein